MSLIDFLIGGNCYGQPASTIITPIIVILVKDDHDRILLAVSRLEAGRYLGKGDGVATNYFF